ncbi:hypothetical protein QJQ45_021804, partial [Haematococcus lacustris]
MRLQPSPSSYAFRTASPYGVPRFHCGCHWHSTKGTGSIIRSAAVRLHTSNCAIALGRPQPRQVSAAYRKEGEGEGASAADPPGSYLDIDLRTGLPHFKSSAAAPIPASSQTNTQYYQAVPPTPLAGLPPLPLPPLPAQQPDDMSLAQAQMLAARAQQMQQQQAQVLQQLEATEQLQLQAAAAGRLGTSLPNSTTAAITPPTVTPTPLSAATPPSTHYLQLQDQHRQQQSMQQVAAQQHAMEVSAQREAALQQQRQELQLAWQELAAQRAQLQAAQLSIMEQKQRMEAAAHAAHEQQVAAARRQASAQEAQRGQDQAGQGRGQGGGQQQQSGQQGLLQHQVKEAGRSNRHEAGGDSEERQLQRLLREADVQMGELRRQEQRSLAGQQGAGAVPGLGFEAQGSGFPSQATQPQMEQSGGSSWSGAGQDCQAQPQAQAHRAAGSDAFGPGGQQAAQQKEQQQREQQQREQQQREQQQQLAQQQQQEQLERDQQEAHRQQAHEQQQQQQEKEQQQQEQAEKAARAAQEQQARQLQKQQEEALALAADQAYDMKNYAMEAVGGGTQEVVVVGRLAASLLGLLSIGALGGCAFTLMKPDMVFEMLTGAVIPDQETFGLLLCAAATLAPIATALMQLCRLSDYHLAGSQLGMQLSYACLMWGLTNAASVASAVWQAAGVTDVMAGWFAACALTALTAAHVLRRALVTSQQVTVVSADGALIQARPHLAKRLFVGIKSSLVAVLSFFVPRTLPSALFAFSSLACFGVGLAVALPDLQDQVLGGRWLASVAQLTDTTPEAMPAAFAARLLVAGWYAASTLFYSLKELADKRLMSSPAARMLSAALGLMACTNAGLLLLGIKDLVVPLTPGWLASSLTMLATGVGCLALALRRDHVTHILNHASHLTTGHLHGSAGGWGWGTSHMPVAAQAAVAVPMATYGSQVMPAVGPSVMTYGSMQPAMQPAMQPTMQPAMQPVMQPATPGIAYPAMTMANTMYPAQAASLAPSMPYPAAAAAAAGGAAHPGVTYPATCSGTLASQGAAVVPGMGVVMGPGMGDVTAASVAGLGS